MTCKHTHAIYRMVYRGEVVDVMGCYLIAVGEDNFGYGDSRIIRSARCNVCRAVLSLGPSNDAPSAVRVEIRAAEVAGCEWNAHDWNAAECHGNVTNPHDAVDRDVHLGVDEVDPWWSGWLAREIATHDDRDARDTTAWPWDTTRPVAGQYEEWISADIAKAASDALARGSELGARRIAFLESDQAQAIVANTTATLDRLRPSRVPYAEDQLPLPVVNAPALPPLTAAEEVLEVIYSSLDNVDDETRDRELARVGIRWFEVEPLDEVATDTRLKALEAGQVELALAPAALDALPSRLRRARKIADLGIGRAAKLLEIPSAELEDIEAGTQEISEFDLLAFSDAYSVSLVWLTSGSGQPRSGS